MMQQDEKWWIGHMEDLAVTADQNGYATCSDFLDDHQRSLLSRMERRLPACMTFFGGYPEAERCIAVFYPEYLAETLEECMKEALALILIEPLDLRFVKKIPGHRDYLGALMGTGIRRDKLGDILTTDRGAYVWTKRDMVPYLTQELTSVGASSVMAREVPFETMPEPEKGTEMVISVSSMRLDAVVSRGFNLGRSEAAKHITAGKVFRAGEQILDADKPVSVGDHITLRGKGRICILENKGCSRSGRIQLLLERQGERK